jgi:hypothetical protein
MALSKKIIVQGTQYIETATGKLPVGETSVEMDAYIRVNDVIAKKPVSFIDVEIKTGDVGRMEQHQFEADLSDNAENHIKQAYKYLKTLPEFAGAVDC